MESRIKLGIVVAEFNSAITAKMLDQALKHATELNAKPTYVCKVPGAYDMPLMIQMLLEKGDVDAVVTLGAIVKGETDHDQVIANALASKASDLSLRYKKPVTLGVSGPSMTWEQAAERAEEYANRSVESAVKMVRLSQETLKTTERIYEVGLQ
ncbi:MAG TPA: 6,7-dimethyl-8-ribityllumazine synthase [Candidatus Bathyarchaeia archaeon]|nr:6,7-dimethyl-8-ribityllumazine synthase [Candidatus Bathyarchaeia archaeon]